MSRSLRGSCGCGRNNYVIVMPETAAESARIFFESSSESRRMQAAPLMAWLRVPLSWFQSNTTSFFPDETHATIRRTFTSTNEPQCKRNFCGFCGTHLTHWSEDPEDEANYLNVTVGSLLGEDLRALEELGLLTEVFDGLNSYSIASPSPVVGRNHSTQLAKDGRAAQKTLSRGFMGDLTWMEDMLDGSRLGRSEKSKRGLRKIVDGTKEVEWEINEMVDDGPNPEFVAGRAKRKLG